MTDKEKVWSILEMLSDACEKDIVLSSDIQEMLDMTLEEYWKKKIEEYYMYLRHTPEKKLKTKMSDLIKQYLD